MSELTYLAEENQRKLEDYERMRYENTQLRQEVKSLERKLKAIDYAHSSTLLKDKWDITFEQWIELYYTPYNATYMTNKHGILKTKKELRKYFNELKQSL